jgi:ferredoxin
MPKLIHYRQRCIGCNACVEIDFERWRISKKDGKATLIGGVDKKDIFQLDIKFADIAICETVIKACPVNVIRIEGKI